MPVYSYLFIDEVAVTERYAHKSCML